VRSATTLALRQRQATEQPDIAFAWLHRAHWVLLGLGLATVFAAVAGSHGWLIFL